MNATATPTKKDTHVGALIFSIDMELTPKSRALLDYLKSLETDTTPPVAAVPPNATTELIPRVGERWPAKVGIYAGIARGLDGEPEGHLVLLDAVPERDMNWADATAWAAAIGDGARLPTRFEAALLYANLQDKVPTGDWYWTCTQYSANDAWYQDFVKGYQDDIIKSYEGRCRAVRRLVLQSFNPLVSGAV